MPDYVDINIKGNASSGWFKSWFRKGWFVLSYNWFDVEVNDK